MAVTILEATAVDVPALVDVHAAAFRSDGFSNLMLINKPENAHHLLMERSINHWLDNPGAHIIKAVNTEGNVFGWACWVLKNDEAWPEEVDSSSSPEQGNTAGRRVSARVTSVQQTETSDPALILGGLMHREATRWTKSCLQGQKHVVLQALACHPDFQGRGFGSQLVKQIADMTDEDCLPCWAHASPAGHDLYIRAGFQEVGYTEFNLDEWAPAGKENDQARGLYRFRYMLRPGRRWIIPEDTPDGVFAVCTLSDGTEDHSRLAMVAPLSTISDHQTVFLRCSGRSFHQLERSEVLTKVNYYDTDQVGTANLSHADTDRANAMPDQLPGQIDRGMMFYSMCKSKTRD